MTDWPEFLESFKRRHPAEYAREGGNVEPGRAEAPRKAPEVVKAVPVAQDNKSKAAGDDWDAVEVFEDDEPESVE